MPGAARRGPRRVRALRRPGAFLLAAAAAGCGVSYEKTGEQALLDRPGLALAVVQVYEALPWHYYGLRHTLACRSPATVTAASPAHRSDGLAPGWTAVGWLPGVPGRSPSKSVREKGLADAVAASRDRIVVGEGWIAWRERVLRVSVDGCASFAEFVPWRSLPPEDIAPAPRPDSCRPEMDCRHFDFEGPRAAAYSDIAVVPLGGSAAHHRISAVMRSSAIRDGAPRRVVTEDGGRTWRVERLPG
jgi:hypothetical protein